MHHRIAGSLRLGGTFKGDFWTVGSTLAFISVCIRAIMTVCMWLLAFLALPGQTAFPQTPTVQLTNLTRGGTDFVVGDEWRIDVTGPPFQDVKGCATHNGSSLGCTVFGQTSAGNAFQLSGVMDASTIGSWVQTWYVGDIQATPVLQFEVDPPPCEGYALPIPPIIFSYDHYYWPYMPFPDWIDGGAALVGAQITSANCAFVFTSFQPLGYPQMISGYLDLISPLTLIWIAYDNQTIGAYGMAVRCFDCFYPVIQSAAFSFIAVDNYSNLYIMNTGVGLYVERILW